MTPGWYTVRGAHTGAWLVQLGHDPALYAPEDWRYPDNRRALGEGTWGLRHGVLLRIPSGCLLVQGPMWLTDLDARARVWAADRRAARAARRERAQQRRLDRISRTGRTTDHDRS